MQKIKGLDTLRAFAVFFVIIEHFGVWFDYTSPSGAFIKDVIIPSGGFGVHLFFVLSGFLITAILLDAKKTNNGKHPVFIIKNFYARRALRIFPIYYLLLALLFLINYPEVRQDIGYYVTYTSNLLMYRTNRWSFLGHTWTLSIEEQFYLLWPWLIIFVKDKYLKYVFAGSLLLGIITTYIGMVVQGHMAPFLVFNSFDAFGLGGLYAWSRADDLRRKNFETSLNVVFVGAFFVYCYWNIAHLYHHAAIALWMGKTVDSVISLWLIVRTTNNKSRLVGKYVLGNRALNYIGKISYGIYLYHYPYILHFCYGVNKYLYDITLPYPALNRTIHDHHVDYWIQVSIMILIAAISYELIEKPILSLKRKFSYEDAVKDVVPVAQVK